ncbi:MAG TPA: hypothetical protein VJ725_27080, partial [Thermoanaerobaculia bacterium]|nr:hypothetical protein [Thermoanaerobaculia bacterium]
VDTRLAGITEPRFANLVAKARKALDDAKKQIDGKLAEAEVILAGAPSNLDQIKRDFKKVLQDLQDGVAQALDFSGTVTADLDATVQKLSDAVTLGLKILDEARKAAEKKIDDTFVEPERMTQALVDALGDELTAKLLGTVFNDFKARLGVAVVEICNQVLSGLEDAFKNVLDSVLGADAAEALRKIKEALQGTTLEELRRNLQAAIEGLGRDLAPLADQLQKGLRETLGGAVAQLADNTLRLLRAFGDAPIVPGLDFNRRQIAYFFDELKNAVDLTPVVALVNRIGDELKGLGLRIPTGQLLDRILPNPLQGFDLSKIFPDFAGLKLDGLFPGLRMPAIANDNVKVTHGVDPQSRRAWVQADVDVPVNEPTNVFSTGPIALRLLRSRFQARARVEATLDGPPRQTVSGKITGDWQISVLSTPIVVFRDTALIFEDGRLRFDLSPDKIELTAALRFLADLMKKIGYSEGGFSVRLLEEGGLPVGVQSVLDLPLPDMAAGAFAITSLRLGSTFTLKIRPVPGGVDFLLSTTFNLGRKEAPFALTIAILTGGGWLEAEASYAPRSNQLATRVSVGVVAGGSLAFAFGPVRGGVYIFFGIEAEFASRSGAGGGQSLNIAILLLVRGEVQIFGFISVGIHLLLQAQYQQSGRLIGTGTLSLSIKISWFVTIRVSTSVRYEFAKGSGGGAQNELAAAESDDPIQKAATEYIGMLD